MNSLDIRRKPHFNICTKAVCAHSTFLSVFCWRGCPRCCLLLKWWKVCVRRAACCPLCTLYWQLPLIDEKLLPPLPLCAHSAALHPSPQVWKNNAGSLISLQRRDGARLSHGRLLLLLLLLVVVVLLWSCRFIWVSYLHYGLVKWYDAVWWGNVSE